jgi:EmrB/QacA subfamily drug resistance transporter
VSASLTTACDAGAITATPAGTVRYPRLVLATTILASSLAFVDGSVVNVGLPAIGHNLGAGAADLQWVVNAYLLPLSALLLLGGAAGDRFGRRRLLVAGVVLFALASAACALAPGLDLLLAGRATQGVGAALLLPNSLAILGGAFSGTARGKAIGTWAAMGAVTGAVGPVLGGWLIYTVGWRAIFLINLPLAVLAVGLALGFVRDPPAASDRAALDVAGAILATLALAALTWAMTIGSGPQGWSVVVLATLVVGVALSAGFVATEKRLGERAMAPLSLFGSRDFVGLTLLTLLLYAALGGLLVLLPYVLIRASHYSGTAAGAALLPFPLILAVASPGMGGLAGRIGARIPLTIGPLAVAGGFLLLLRVGSDSDYWTAVLPAIVVISLGMSGAVAPLTTAVLASVDARHTGSASGLNSAVARIGGLVATAVLGAALAAHGAGLIASAHVAALVGAAVSLAASLCALVLIRGQAAGSDPRPGRRKAA